MGKVQYFDNNLQVRLDGRLEVYQETKLTPDSLVMVYDEATNGPIDDSLPYRIKFVVEDGVVEEYESGPYAGQFDYTAGTLKKVVLYNEAGDVLMKITGLDVSMPYISAMIASESGYSAVNHILGQGHRFYGSDVADLSDPGSGDSIDTGVGDDIVYAGKGGDWIYDTGGKDVYRGGGGDDTVVYFNHRWASPADTDGIVARLDKGFVIGTDGIRDKIVSIERVQGSMFDDRMIGDNGDNRFEGLGGNDFFNGKGGWDVLRFDYRDWLGGVQGVKVNMANGTARDSWGNTDTFKNIEEVRGSDYDDVLRDDSADNAFQGEDGNDKLFFGRGNDYAEGGNGADKFIFRGNNFGNDYIEDFEDGIDLLKIENAPDFAALTIVQVGDDTLVQWNGNAVGLKDVTSTDIGADDFIF